MRHIQAKSKPRAVVDPHAVEHSVGRCTGDPADIAHRQPVLREAHRLLRLEERVGLLIPEQARLQLDVGAVVVRQGAPPLERVRVHAPGPHFVCRQLRGHCDVDGARRRARVIDADEWFARAVGEQRYRSGRLIADDAQVAARLIDRPRLYPGETMGRHEFCRVHEPRVVPDFNRCIGPPVITMPRVREVVQRDRLLEHRAPWTQAQLDTPGRTVNSVDVAHPDRRAAVRLRAHREVDRRHRHPVVRDGKVELDAEGGPGAAVADEGLLDGRIRVEQVPAADLVDAAMKMTTQVGQYGHAQVLVFEVQRPPLLNGAAVAQCVAKRVGIIEPRERKEIERRVRIGQPFCVCRKLE